ncbi:TIGR04283 family arsenosugar biosynthesis glycosyltransferase [Algoriphagus machipongonensis]|uniref:Glycosyl transferase n=1 Tax=Algoriphagus machipongonensis TaxID=388413 RepID=A3HSR7_9BACT|nr:TIGR04283 family arsenosugar biosynthesis glycosyltransferase [Algoriphagus machipongonensis]EAZ82885.1 glycosyl transferase [Algoriphagus machipongonensis]
MIEKPSISIIIPTLNEEENLKTLISHIQQFSSDHVEEIIVSDGGSTDQSIQVAKSLGATVIISPKKGRAAQMNYAASHAKSSIFYFIHADVKPVKGFDLDIIKNCKMGKVAGCYRYRFDKSNSYLKLNSWFTRFNGIFTGGGDQTLYITRRFFEELDGFDEKYSIMEDFDLVRRIRKTSQFHIIPREITVSSRKYESNSWLRVQVANLAAFILFLMKSNPNSIKSLYCNLINKKKAVSK